MKLTINNIEADYIGEIAISRQTFDSNDLGLRLIDISNKIVLPDTSRNRKIIQGTERLESTALDVVYDCKVIDDTIIFAGEGVISKVGKQWTIQLVDFSKAFFKDLKRKLKKLDFESEWFEYGSAAYATYKSLTSSVWVWPIVQMYDGAVASNLQYLRPHFSFWSIIEKIFSSRGWTIAGDTTHLQNLAIQANDKDFFFSSYQKTLAGSTIGNLTVNDFENVVSVTMNNKFDSDLGYSGNSYDLSSATKNGILYPSLDPSIFEVKFPDSDIKGRIVKP